MHLTTFVLGCCLLGQASGAPPPLAVGDVVSDNVPARRQWALPEVVAEALKAPAAGKLTGRPLTLLAALSATGDRRQQLEVTHAYWRLAEALAILRFGLDYDSRLQELQAGPQETFRLRMARASSAAALREAEVAALAAQHELAVLVLHAPDVPLPLPADPPHVGPYLTHFGELSSTLAAPARARLIDRTLPIRHQAIEQRALAVQAAEAALEAATDRRADLPAVLDCTRQVLRQRQALITSICRYNDDIADYALAVADPRTSPQELVRMLIKPGRDSGVRPAGHEEPVPTPARRPGKNEPTPARRLEDPEMNVPAPAPPREIRSGRDDRNSLPSSGWSPAGKDGPTPAQRRDESEPPPGKVPTFSPLRETIESGESAVSEQPTVAHL